MSQPPTGDRLRGQVTRNLEWSDTDASGHHHNSFLLRLVESAERELVTTAGVRDEYFWSAPRVHQEIDFTSKLYFAQQVTATIWVEAMGRTSVIFAFEVVGVAVGDAPERLAAKGRVVVAHVPHGTEHATEWPEQIRTALAP